MEHEGKQLSVGEENEIHITSDMKCISHMIRYERNMLELNSVFPRNKCKYLKGYGWVFFPVIFLFFSFCFLFPFFVLSILFHLTFAQSFHIWFGICTVKAYSMV